MPSKPDGLQYFFFSVYVMKSGIVLIVLMDKVQLSMSRCFSIFKTK